MTIHCASDLIRRLVHQEVQAELRRRDAEELAQWDRCFDGAPKSHNAKVSRIIQTASARALMLRMRAGASDNGAGASVSE